MNNKGYHISEIAKIVQGQLHLGSTDETIRSISIDSRKTHAASDVLFFALIGERNNGHEYIESLIKAGTTNFVVSDLNYILEGPYNFIHCPNTLDALQALAKYHRKQFNYPVVGITGSNGKTTIKEWLAQLIAPDKQIVRSPKSYNSQVGVPLSIWQMSHEDDLALIEAGISLPGEMQSLQDIIDPEWGVLTNIGEAHSANFENNDQKLLEKLKLFKNSNILFLSEKITQSSVAQTLTELPEIVSFGNTPNHFLYLHHIEVVTDHTSITGEVDNEIYTIEIPVIDKASIENACFCWCILAWMGYPKETVQERMGWIHPLAMRLEIKEGIQQTAIINDIYNSDYGSLEIALDFLALQKRHNKHSIILSDIQQSGHKPEHLYQQIARLLDKHQLDRFIGIGPEIYQHKHLFSLNNAHFYTSTQAFIDSFDINEFNNETILLKGARTFSFEKISKQLQYKTHQTVLEISLNAIEHNLNYFKSKLSSNVLMMCMVKAFSYGAGSFEIANLLQFHNVNYLGVAYADEGIELRKNGISLPIMVMSPERRSFSQMIQQRLEPEIHNFKILKEFIDELLLNFPNIGAYPIHLKIDTGMHRLGFEKQDINKLKDILLKNHKVVKIKSIFSHLAAGDEAHHDSFTRKQIQSFDETSSILTASFDYKILRHIANSAGIQRFPEAQFDMVRLGIGLYGIGVNKIEQANLQFVSRFVSSIAQIRTIKIGESIGYGRRGIAEREIRVATVMLGYADGLSRSLSNGKGALYVKNKPAPIVGNVCMDMCMIDVTDIDANIDDEVIVFDENRSIIDLAKKLNTIPYEIMTSISNRVKRIYYQE